MFLTSDAFRALDERQLRGRDWSATTILYVSHGWNPARDGAQSLTGRRLVNALLRAGARVHVLAASRADEERPSPSYDVTVVPSRPLSASRPRRALQMIRSTVPEAAGEWVSAAVGAGLRALASLPSDTMIYGRASPGASNVVAWHLARLTGLAWVAHFSDEWPAVFVLAKGRRWAAPYKWPLFQFWRRRILRDAGALTFSNPYQCRDILGGSADRHLRKSFVVAHLPSELAPRGNPPQYEVFHVVHTGNLYPGQTSAAVMEGLRRFIDRTPAARGRIRFTQAGWSSGDMPSAARRWGLDDVVRFAGRLPQAEVLALLDGASLLLAIDYARPNSTTVLSKIPDYVNAARPVLAVTAPSSALGRLFSEDGVGLTARYDSPGEVADRVSAVFEAWRRGRLDPLLPKDAAVESYDWRRVLAELAGAFQVACAARRPGRAETGAREWARLT